MKGLWCVVLVAVVGGWIGACADGPPINRAPVFSDIPGELRTSVGEPVALVVSATDPDGDAVTIEMTEAPEGAQFVFNSFGRFSWIPEPGDGDAMGKPHEIHFEAVDARGARETRRLVVKVSNTESATRFTTTNSRVLDLSREEELVARVVVQDNDTLEVPLVLQDAPEGMLLDQVDDKSADMRWRPSESQIGKQLIWGATIVADDGSGSPVSQQMTVTLVPKGCSKGAIEILHEPLDSQRGAEGYRVEALILPPDERPVEATLFWRLGGDPDTSGGFEGVKMADEGTGFWGAVISNPDLIEGEVLDLYYFIVATQEGGDSHVGCVSREPDQGRHSFTVFAAGDTTCREDPFEPNDGFSQAFSLTEASVQGGAHNFYGLALCQGDVDVFSLELPSGKAVEVVASYSRDAGDLRLRLLNEAEAVVAEVEGGEETVLRASGLGQGRHYLEVSGAEVGYGLRVSVVEDAVGVCEADEFEPNDTLESAAAMAAGEYVDLSLCDQKDDFFEIQVPRGATLRVNAFFEHAAGDLDLYLEDPGGVLLASSLTTDDNEQLTWRNTTSGGVVKLAAILFGGIGQLYDLRVEVDEGEVGSCSPDEAEPDDTFSAASGTLFDGDFEVERTMCEDGVDYFGLVLLGGEPLRIDLVAHGEVDLDVRVHDQIGGILHSSVRTGPEEHTVFTPEAGGIHYISVQRFGMGTVDYTLSVSFEEPALPCEADENEPDNDGLGGAFMLRQYGSGIDAVGLCQQDADWYVLLFDELDVIQFVLDAESVGGGDPREFMGPGSARLEIYDGAGMELLESGEFNPRSERRTLWLDGHDGGVVLVKISNDSAHEAFVYDLETIYFIGP